MKSDEPQNPVRDDKNDGKCVGRGERDHTPTFDHGSRLVVQNTAEGKKTLPQVCLQSTTSCCAPKTVEGIQASTWKNEMLNTGDNSPHRPLLPHPHHRLDLAPRV